MSNIKFTFPNYIGTEDLVVAIRKAAKELAQEVPRTHRSWSWSIGRLSVNLRWRLR